jgi:hypothetical protein
MKFYKAKITRTQTSFSTNFGDNLSFIVPFLFFPERLHFASSTLIDIFSLLLPACTTTIITLEPSASPICWGKCYTSFCTCCIEVGNLAGSSVDFWAILMLNCTDSKLRNPSTLGLLLLTPIKSDNNEELCEAALWKFC